MSVVTLNENQLSGGVPPMISDFIPPNEWVALCSSYNKAYTEAGCCVCGAEWLICCLFAFPCIFCCHPCLFTCAKASTLDR
jgi:hypothetical protein